MVRASAVRAAGAVWGPLVPYWRIVRLLPGVSAPMALGVAAGVALGVLLPLGSTLATGALVGAVPAAIAGGPDLAGGPRGELRS